MEAAEGVEIRGRGKAEREPDRLAAEVAGTRGNISRGPPLSGTSYWLDLWLMILFDLVLFVFVYLLP
uniref:HCV F-transactivated protein 1 n=1 Tax=Naja naja TaxID=35670 RepID=A0A8C6X6F1_NAJNA